MEFFAGAGVPDYEGCVCAAGDEDRLVVEVEMQECGHEVGVAEEASPGGAGGGAPGPDGFVPAAGEEGGTLKGWREGETGYWTAGTAIDVSCFAWLLGVCCQRDWVFILRCMWCGTSSRDNRRAVPTLSAM